MTLEASDLAIARGDFRLAADWALPAGTSVAVMGPSGAGKTTLLHAVAGFVPIASGRLAWDGRDITDAPPDARPVTMLFQRDNLFPTLDAASNVGLGIRPGRLRPSERRHVEEALDRVGLGGMGGRRPHELSGGEQGRVALARALLRDRPLMLLDEPFGALGPGLKGEMLDLTAEFRAETGATLMMVSHDPDEARRIADHLILVAEGRAHPPQPMAGALSDPPPALARYLGF